MIHFDHAAATVPLPEAVEFHAERLRHDHFNQEAAHREGRRLRRELDAAAARLSEALLPGLPPRAVIWGNSASELFNLLADSPVFAGRRIAVGKLEHPALAAAVRRAAKSTFAVANDRRGVLIPPAPDAAAGVETAVCHAVQSELGVRQDPAAFFAGFPGAVRVLDAVQAAGKLPLGADADVTVISGVKFGAPGGAALLLDPAWRGAEALLRFAHDYRHRDYRMGRVSFAAAATLAFTAGFRAERLAADLDRIAALNRTLREGMLRLGAAPTVPEEAASPYILHLSLRREPGAVIARMLSESEILAASGSACAAESPDPSPALLAIGRNREAAYRGLRLSFGFDTGAADTDFLLSTMEKVLKNF